MLSYNKIRELSGLHPVLSGMMQNPSCLQWIDISHNFLTILDYSFEDFPHLKTLYLHCNFISDLV
jgi:Leucine-rich repeat (LRR) protein